jgi:biopolymer transport protein ExbD
MSIRCQCPHCGTLVSIYDRIVGHRIRCPSCEKLIEAQPYNPTSFEPTSPPAPPATGQAITPPRAAQAPPVVAAPPLVEGSAGGDAAESAIGLVAVPNKRKPIIFREERKGAEAEMDMTPMVDVVFQLLIFFMLTASFTMQKSQQHPKPESNEPSSQPKSVEDFQQNPDYVVVRVDAQNTFHVSSALWEDEIEAPSLQELLVKLREARQGDSQGNVPSKMLVIASSEALHEWVVTAIDAGNDVGMDEVQLVTAEDDEGA